MIYDLIYLLVVLIQKLAVPPQELKKFKESTDKPMNQITIYNPFNITMWVSKVRFEVQGKKITDMIENQHVPK